MIGYKFPRNGAVVIATAPADNDSIIVLCKYQASPARTEWITGRVYTQQLPFPDEWDAGTYRDTVEGAVESFVDRAGLVMYGGDTEREKIVKSLAVLVRTTDERLHKVRDLTLILADNIIRRARLLADLKVEDFSGLNLRQLDYQIEDVTTALARRGTVPNDGLFDPKETS